MLPVLVIKAIEVVAEGSENGHATGFRITKERKRFVGGLLQVAETNDVAKGLDAVQYAVGAAVGLQQSVIAQILVNPKGVKRGSIEASEEHIHHKENVNLTVFHSQRHIFIVVGEFVGGCVVTGAKHLVIVLDGSLQELTAAGIQSFGIVVVLVAVLIGVCFVCPITEDGGQA